VSDIGNRLKTYELIIKNIFGCNPLRKRLENSIILSHITDLMEKTLSLNVGCGATNQYPFRNFNCEINCDISVPEMNIKNYIRCEAMHLPFRPIFDCLIASHLIEHLPDPEKSIEEFKRISNYILIIIPHALSPNAYFDSTHLWVRFAGKWLRTPHILKVLVRSIFLNLGWQFISLIIGLPRQKILEIKGRHYERTVI